MEEREENYEDSEEPGHDADVCREYVAYFLFVVRATRQDGYYAVIRLGRAVGRWKRKHDRALFKLVCYF